MCRFFNQICENKIQQLRKLPKILKSDSVKIIHYYSFVSLDGREGPRALGEADEVVAGVRLPVGGDREADLVRAEGLRGRPAVRGPAAE